MMFRFLSALMLSVTLLLPPAAEAQRRGDQQQVFEAMRDGRVLPLKEIERRVRPQYPDAQYIGVEFDGATGIYTLKFLRNGTVIWVDVDGRTGQVVGRFGR